MAKVHIFNIPFHGHVNPSLPVVKELVRAKEDVTYWLTPDFSEKVTATGAKFQPYFDTFQFDPNQKITNVFHLGSVLADAAMAYLPAFIDHYHQLKKKKQLPDYILTDSSTLWGNYLGQLFEIPVVTLYPNIAFKPQMLISHRMLRLKFGYDFLKGLPYVLKAGVKMVQLQTKYQLTEFSLSDVLITSSQTNIVLTSSYFQPQAELLPNSFRFVGPITGARPKDKTWSFQKAAGQQLVYISLGTIYNKNLKFYRQCFEAFGQNPMLQVIMSVGSQATVEALGSPPPNFLVKDRVPQLEVLKQADLFVTHAGMNSLTEAIQDEVPMVTIPQTIEQTVNALRLVELGAATYNRATGVTVAKLKDSVSRVLTDPTYLSNVLRIKDSFETAGGAKALHQEIKKFKKAHAIK